MKKNIVAYSIIVLLFQSCAVYDKTSVSLNEAAGKGKVKLFSISGEMHKFSNIEKVNSIYYGVGRKNISETNYITKPELRMPLDSTLVAEIYFKNVNKSERRSVSLLLLLCMLPLFLLA